MNTAHDFSQNQTSENNFRKLKFGDQNRDDALIRCRGAQRKIGRRRRQTRPAPCAFSMMLKQFEAHLGFVLTVVREFMVED